MEAESRSPGTDVSDAHAPLYLAIDQGGHASRALLIDDVGSVVGRGNAEVGTREPWPDWSEQDPDDVLHSIVSSVRQALPGNRSAKVLAAGLVTQRSNIVCWRAGSGEPLSPIIGWQDRRGREWIERFAPHQDLVQAHTGLRLSPHYGASKLHWCLENLPAVHQALAHGDLCIGPLASFLVYRLTAERSFVVDPANAARTLLYHLEGRDWDPELLRLFEVPRQVLPRCVPTRGDFGSLDIDNRRIALRVVSGDQAAALFGYGAPRAEVAYVNIGTGAFVQRLCGPTAQRHPRLLTSIAFGGPGADRYVLEGTVNGAGSALAWAEKELGLEDLGIRLGTWLEHEQCPDLFLNGIGGLGAPFWDPAFASSFVGCGEPWQKAAAVAESIVFLIHENLLEMQHYCAPLQRIQASGGLARLDGLCQRLADISRVPVFRPAEQEATARGVAFLLQNAPATWPESAGTQFVPVENRPFQERYRQWRVALDQALKSRLSCPC